MAAAVTARAILVNIGYLHLGAHTSLVCVNIMPERTHRINQPEVLPCQDASAHRNARKGIFRRNFPQRPGASQFHTYGLGPVAGATAYSARRNCGEDDGTS